MDVTDTGTVDSDGNADGPGSLTETNAANVVLWEFADADYEVAFSQPSLVRRSGSGDTTPGNNPWVAVFGNGYNSNNPAKGFTPVAPSATAVLFVVNVENGSVIRKIDLREGLGAFHSQVLKKVVGVFVLTSNT
ncbi:MAG: hypothetical protein MZW92_54970 [Comamonadaceae bacterium]|nr:hypothetical protein [Comamonadaceae bacterium]